uniref:THAP-type domain-containing protein n=1 Tax=Neogobius melanostomus TaxID=47308 RepID=A0A8C6T736_9GOBI
MSCPISSNEPRLDSHSDTLQTHCVTGDANGRYNSELSFHRFPKHKSIRAQWLHKIRRTAFSVTQHTKVCSRHFTNDLIRTTAKGKRILAASAVPSLFEWNGYTNSKTRAGVWERRTRPTPSSPDPVAEESEEEIVEAMVPMPIDHDYGASPTVCVDREQYEKLQDEIEILRRQVQTLHLQSSFGLQRFKLLPIDELFLFLSYLSTGCTQRELGHRFNIHRATVSRIIVTWANFLYSLLGSVCTWMSPAAVKASLPQDFHGSYSDTHVVLDCTELRCQTPSSLLLQSHGGNVPHGALTFVSALFEGSMSDREVFRQSGITSLLTPDMAIMVDKGFLVDNLVPGTVHRPAFLSKRTQMLEVDVLKTQSIARLRVHVERMIRRVKENKLFDSIIPLSISGSINQIFTVACLLTNYQNGPLVKKWVYDV